MGRAAARDLGLSPCSSTNFLCHIGQVTGPPQFPVIKWRGKHCPTSRECCADKHRKDCEIGDIKMPPIALCSDFPAAAFCLCATEGRITSLNKPMKCNYPLYTDQGTEAQNALPMPMPTLQPGGVIAAHGDIPERTLARSRSRAVAGGNSGDLTNRVITQGSRRVCIAQVCLSSCSHIP